MKRFVRKNNAFHMLQKSTKSEKILKFTDHKWRWMVSHLLPLILEISEWYRSLSSILVRPCVSCTKTLTSLCIEHIPRWYIIHVFTHSTYYTKLTRGCGVQLLISFIPPSQIFFIHFEIFLNHFRKFSREIKFSFEMPSFVFSMSMAGGGGGIIEGASLASTLAQAHNH